MSHVHKEASSGIASATIQLEEAIKSFGQLCTYLMGKGADQSK